MRINTEYRKGIIFLRIKGYLDKKSYKELLDEVNNIIENFGITNIVLNLDEITRIDMKGISSIYFIYEKLKKYKGSIYLCSNNNEVKSKLKKERLFKYINEIDSELKAFDLIKI